MFVSEVYEMLQDSFEENHYHFPIPKKELKEAPLKFQSAMGEFTVLLNEHIRVGITIQLTKIEKRCIARIEQLKFHKFLFSALLGVSIIINIMLVIKIFI